MVACRSLTENCIGTDNAHHYLLGVCNYYKISRQRDTFQGFSGRIIVILCLDEEGYPSMDIEGVIRGRARQSRMKLGQTDVCALNTTNSEKRHLEFHQKSVEARFLSLKYGNQTSKLLMHF